MDDPQGNSSSVPPVGQPPSLPVRNDLVDEVINSSTADPRLKEFFEHLKRDVPNDVDFRRYPDFSVKMFRAAPDHWVRFYANRYNRDTPEERIKLVLRMWHQWPAMALAVRELINRQSRNEKRRLEYHLIKDERNAKRRERYMEQKMPQGMRDYRRFLAELRSRIAAIPLMIEDGTP